MANLTFVAPFFIVADLRASVAFYDPNALFQEYRSRGIDFHQPLLDDGDGLRGFEVADADGYILFFGRPV